MEKSLEKNGGVNSEALRKRRRKLFFNKTTITDNDFCRDFQTFPS